MTDAIYGQAHEPRLFGWSKLKYGEWQRPLSAREKREIHAAKMRERNAGTIHKREASLNAWARRTAEAERARTEAA
jgi:hypothetical protein